MIPYKEINSFEEVKLEYPKYFDFQFLRRKETIKFYNEELEKLQNFWGPYKKPQELKDIALARALYDFLWCVDNITTTMSSWGWKPADILILRARMKSAGYDPFSISDVVGEYLYNLKGHGFVEITRPDGTIFLAYDPKGVKKPRKVKTDDGFEEEKVMWEDRELNPLEIPEDDNYDDW